MKKTLSMALVVLVALGFVLNGYAQQAPTPAQVYRIKMASAGPPTMATRLIMEKSKDILEQKSNGRLKIDYFISGALFPESEQLESCSRGVVQIAMAASGPFWNSLGIVYDVRLLPFGYVPKDFGKYYREPGSFYDWSNPFFQKSNLKLLVWAMQGAVQAFFNKPARTLEDLKGRVVATSAGNGMLMVKALGMTPTVMPGPELLLAFQKGTIDGNVASSVNSMIGYGAVPYAKYEVEANFWEGNTPIVCNLQWLNSLPKDLQQLIINTFIDLEKEHYANYDNMLKGDSEQFMKQGGEVYRLPPAEFARWKAAIQPIYQGIEKKYPADWPRFLEATKKFKR